MQKNVVGEVMLHWALEDHIGKGEHAIYANWNPQEQSFEAWSRYRRSGQERKDRKRFIEALINRTTWKLLEDPQYYGMLPQDATEYKCTLLFNFHFSEQNFDRI